MNTDDKKQSSILKILQLFRRIHGNIADILKPTEEINENKNDFE